MIPVHYIMANVSKRFFDLTLALFGICLVVAVFIVTLALMSGFNRLIKTTGSDLNGVFFSAGISTEKDSYLTRDETKIFEDLCLEYVAKDKDGHPLISSEVLISFPDSDKNKADSSFSFYTVRGLNSKGIALRSLDVKLVQGRWFESGKNEIIVGQDAQFQMSGPVLGNTIHFANRDWKIVGVFDAGGNFFNLQIWGDSEELLNAFSKTGFQSVVFRLNNPADISKIEQLLKNEQRLSGTVEIERGYYESQGGDVAIFIKAIGFLVFVIMAIGSTLGIINIVNGLVLARVREIAILRTIGFSRFLMFVSLMGEVVVISIVGGFLGYLVALFFDGMSANMTSLSFSAVMVFSVKIDHVRHLLYGLMFSVSVGGLGALWPVFRGTRIKIVDAFRH